KRPHLAFDPQSMARLLTYNWPGNVRELHNVIERAVILSGSSRVTVDEMLLPPMQAEPSLAIEQPENLGEVERNHIMDVLGRTKWRIYGDQGAAHLLGLNPETLRSRLRKLGIRRPSSRPPEPSSLP
ncbi:MAG: AAA-type ATPase lid domain-containing protein, partial [Nitrospira sp.]